MADLITLTEYKAYSGILSTNQDATIVAIIPKVSALVRSICRRDFNLYTTVTKEEKHNGGYDRLLLKEYPIIEIEEVKYSPDYGATEVILTEGIDFVVDPEMWELVSTSRNGFPLYIGGYTVKYKAGFDPLPEDLKLAVMDLVTYYIKNDGAIKSTRNAGSNTVQIEYITTVKLPAHIQRVLDLYVANYL